jgi:hypothetical protein
MPRAAVPGMSPAGVAFVPSHEIHQAARFWAIAKRWLAKTISCAASTAVTSKSLWLGGFFAYPIAPEKIQLVP